MNEKLAKRIRVNEKLAYVVAFELWLKEEPPIFRIIKWRLWKKRRPVRKDYEK